DFWIVDRAEIASPAPTEEQKPRVIALANLKTSATPKHEKTRNIIDHPDPLNRQALEVKCLAEGSLLVAAVWLFGGGVCSHREECFAPQRPGCSPRWAAACFPHSVASLPHSEATCSARSGKD